jgi:type VI secretion system protein ImpF
MAHLDLPPGLLPSLKDRLLDPGSMGTKGHPGYSLVQILESVREDLDELLNTRSSHQVLETQYPEVTRSIVTYGLPDITALSGTTSSKHESIGRLIETIILQHEPRLRNVRATMVMPGALDMRVVYHIDAELRVDPFPPVDFDTEVELITGHAKIREGAD